MSITAESLCPACASSRFKPIDSVKTDRLYQVMKCSLCALVFTSPRPTAEELKQFYGRTYFKKDVARVGGYGDYAGVPEANARLMWAGLREESWIRDAAPGRRRLLDVGAATGGFQAAAMSEGWDTLGVEYSSDAIERGRTVHGVPMIEGDVFHPSLDGRIFDLITLFHVLEHTIEPGRVLKRCAELTASGGRCLVELPSWASLGRRVRGNRWLQLRPPEHINFFTPRSLARAMREAGFVRVIARSTYPSLTNHLKTTLTMRGIAKGLAGHVAQAIGVGGYARAIGCRPD